MLKGKGSRFFRASSAKVRVLVLSKATVVNLHWRSDLNRSQRCAGFGCSLCAAGNEPEERAYFWVRMGDGSDKILEIRARQEEHLLAKGVVLDALCGHELEIWRKGQAFNAPIQVESVGTVVVQPGDGPPSALIGMAEPEVEESPRPGRRRVKVHDNDPLAGSDPTTSFEKRRDAF